MRIDKRDVKLLDLWPHQLAAVQKVERYFKSDSKRGCLVQMPTGTGKTGIMATLATRRAVAKPVLVACPSAALVNQLIDEFKSAFWEKIGASDDWRPEIVVKLLPSTVADVAGSLAASTGQRAIVVSTIQAIESIHQSGKNDDFRKLIGTILFDEGHREPAPTWADVIRGYQVPTVLFSATPFRGDLKVFDVDDEHIHFQSFSSAVEKALIRGIEIVPRPLSNNATEFAKQIVAVREELIAQRRFPATCKMIVRAASEEDVTELFQALSEVLERKSDKVLALHDNFPNNEAGRVRAVPRNLKDRTERYLVHQYKLIEGIDDPSCTMLALFQPFENQRMLVQQVGRLTRQPPPIGTKVFDAFVLTRDSDNVTAMWSGFLAYDRACISAGGKPPIRNDQEILKNLVMALPPMDYVAGKFRERLNLEDAELTKDLRFPRSASVFELDRSFNLDNFQAEISKALAAEDRYEHQVGRADHGACRYHVTLRLNQSPFLANYLFQSASLEVTIYARHGDRLFFYDSAGLWIDDFNTIGVRVNSKALRSLLPASMSNVVSFLNVKNSDLGPLAVRGRSMSARSLEASGVFMGEHLNVITRATGRVEKTRRTVGFDRGRVRDGEGSDFTAEDYSTWCSDINDELVAAKIASPILSRFATPSSVPASTDPLNILIDMLELLGEFTTDGKDTGFDREGMCVDVVPDMDPKAPAPFRFVLSIDEKDIDVWIGWEAKKEKYWLTSPSLSKIKAKENAKISLTRRLNQAQPFRIIVNHFEHVYVHGSFYDLKLDLANPNGAGRLVLDLVTPIPDLAPVTSEKGEPANTVGTWQRGSLFRLIDDAIVPKRGPPLFGPKFPAVVCDDLGAEVGDFIGVDDGKAAPRVAFIAAKWTGGDPGVSASAFYDVCSQGIKNLAYLKSDGTELPSSVDKFDKDWTLSSGKGVTKMTDRIPRKRVGPKSKAFRKLLTTVRSAPTTERSVWLVCAGGMLSKAKLEQEFKVVPPKPNVLQFYHLVISAYSSCQSVGVNLRIFSAT